MSTSVCAGFDAQSAFLVRPAFFFCKQISLILRLFLLFSWRILAVQDNSDIRESQEKFYLFTSILMKERLAELIQELGIIKKDFAESIGVSTGNLSDWLSGKTEPSAKPLARISETYKVNLNWLVAGNGPMFLETTIVADQRAVYGKKKKPEGDAVTQLQERLEQLEKDVQELREKK